MPAGPTEQPDGGPAPSDLAAWATDVLREAGERTLHWYGRDPRDATTKADGTPVTEADRDAERFLRRRLAERFPDDGVLGEEEDEHVGTSGRRWILDPIDGTKSFIRTVPLYANLLALEDSGRIVFGAVNLPAAGSLLWAERGAGAWIDGRRAHVSDRTSLDGSYVLASWLEDWPLPLVDELQTGGAAVRTWGDAFGYVMVATGRAEAMVDFEAEPYDLAPMPVILDEAGGRFTALDGLDGIDRGSGLATNGLLHEPLRGLVTRDRAGTAQAGGTRHDHDES